MDKEFRIIRKVRFGDCDPGGVLYTPRIGFIVVEAVLDFVSDCFGAPAERSIMDLGVMPPAKAFSVEFIKPMQWDDELELTVKLKEIRNSAIAYEVFGKVRDEAVFKSELTQVCVDPDTRRPVDVPQTFRKVLKKYSDN